MKFNLKYVLLKLVESDANEYETRDGNLKFFIGESHGQYHENKFYFLVKRANSQSKPEIAITYDANTRSYKWEKWVVASGTTSKIAKYLSEFQNNTKDDPKREEVDKIAKSLGLV